MSTKHKSSRGRQPEFQQHWWDLQIGWRSMRLGSLMERRAILTVVKDAMYALVSKDELLKKALMDDLSEPILRTPMILED
eukprot:12885929-Prorocentrum_lima.AAC.1